MRQALRKLEKSYNDKSKELFETINIGIDNWTPPPIQTEFAEVGECADTPENVGAKNLSPEIDGKTASTESAAEAERDIEWNINKEHAIIKKVDKFSNAIFIHKLPNGEIDFQDMRMPGIVGAYAFANDKWKEKYISDFDVFKEMNSQKDFGMPELFTENDVKVKIGALYDVFCYLFTEDVIETLSKKP
jgi:hypothetical protein